MNSEISDSESDLSLGFKSEMSFNDVLEPIISGFNKDHQEIFVGQDMEYLSMLKDIKHKMPKYQFDMIHIYILQLLSEEKHLTKEMK